MPIAGEKSSIGKLSMEELFDGEAVGSHCLRKCIKSARADDLEPYSVFSAALRAYLTYFLGFAMILSTLTATIYFPLITILSTQLYVSIQAINLTMTIYAIAQALSLAVFASLADSFGRRPVLLCLVVLYAVPSLGLALSRMSYPALLTLRALQSIGGSTIPSISYGVVVDSYSYNELKIGLVLLLGWRE